MIEWLRADRQDPAIELLGRTVPIHITRHARARRLTRTLDSHARRRPPRRRRVSTRRLRPRPLRRLPQLRRRHINESIAEGDETIDEP